MLEQGCLTRLPSLYATPDDGNEAASTLEPEQRLPYVLGSLPRYAPPAETTCRLRERGVHDDDRGTDVRRQHGVKVLRVLLKEIALLKEDFLLERGFSPGEGSPPWKSASPFPFCLDACISTLASTARRAESSLANARAPDTSAHARSAPVPTDGSSTDILLLQGRRHHAHAKA